MSGFDRLRAEARRYYAETFREHGASARGVDWNSEEGQRIRFAQLARLWSGESAVSIVDYGCGYGAFGDYLNEANMRVDYTGYDLCDTMIAHAQAARRDRPEFRFTTDTSALTPADYAVASGVFNVKQDATAAEWERYIYASLDDLSRLGRRGFGFNLLTLDSDPGRRRPHLYYASPEALFAHCRRRFSHWASVLQDYGLYEFTILVRKDAVAR